MPQKIDFQPIEIDFQPIEFEPKKESWLDWAGKGLVTGAEWPSYEDWRSRSYSENVRNALESALLSPIGIAGEVLGAVIPGIQALRTARRLKNLVDIPNPEAAQAMRRSVQNQFIQEVLKTPEGLNRPALPPPRFRFEAGPSSLESSSAPLNIDVLRPRTNLEIPPGVSRDLSVGPVETAGVNIRDIPPKVTAPKPPLIKGGAAEIEFTPTIDPTAKLPEEIKGPAAKLIELARSAKPLTKEQAEIYTKERIERLAKMKPLYKIGGEEGHYARKGALAGEYEKITREPLQLDQGDIDSLFNFIRDTPKLLDFEKINAGDALGRILRGQIPREFEIKLLEEVFGPEYVNTLRATIPKIQRHGGLIHELINLPRALQASMDMSAPLRQGLPLIHRKEWWTSWDDMVKSFGSEKAYKGVMESILNHPNFNRSLSPEGIIQPALAEKAGLKITSLADFTKREEAIMSTLAERIPIIGKGVRASNRAYTAFLNKLRADTFNSLIDDAVKAAGGRMDLDPRYNTDLAREIANYVNNATGRGSLGKLERHAVALNSVFFAPRNIASRVQMLNPANYVMTSPLVRRQYLKSLLSTATFWMTMAGLAKLAGAEVSLDPNSSDFGKIKIGNIRLDPAGGFQQYLVAAHRLISGKFTSPTRGITYPTGQYFGRQTKKDILEQFIANKFNPIFSFAYDMLSASRYRPFNLADRTAQLFVPMVVQDAIEVAKEDPKLIPWLAPLAFFGMGVQEFSRGDEGVIFSGGR